MPVELVRTRPAVRMAPVTLVRFRVAPLPRRHEHLQLAVNREVVR